MSEKKFIIDKQEIKPGESTIVKLAVGKLPSDTRINIQAHVYRSKRPGPTTLVLAGVHGDEINGIEIVRRLLHDKVLKKNLESGSVIVIPLLNIYGFVNFNRYVPDGKDVNRSFPGNQTGSLASRIARTLTKKILPLVDYIFDFHTGGDSRFNHPQIRITKSDTVASELAMVFAAPYIIESAVIAKSLRKTAKVQDIPMLVFEGGESVRLDGFVIEIGYNGLLRCLAYLGNIDPEAAKKTQRQVILLRKTIWIRAPFSGIFLWIQKSGAKVQKGEKLGTINDPNGQKSINVISNKSGYLLCHNNASVINQGDALFHLGYEAKNLL